MTNAEQTAATSSRLQTAYRPLYRNGWLETQRITTQRAISALRESIR